MKIGSCRLHCVAAITSQIDTACRGHTHEQPDLFSTKKAVSDFGAMFVVFSWFLSFILQFEALFDGNRALI